MSNSQLVLDPVRQLYKATGVAASFNTVVYPTDRWTMVALQVNIANASSANFSIQVQVSLDGTNWGNYGAAVAVTTNDVTTFNLVSLAFTQIRLSVTRTAGSADFEILTAAKQG